MDDLVNNDQFSSIFKMATQTVMNNVPPELLEGQNIDVESLMGPVQNIFNQLTGQMSNTNVAPEPVEETKRTKDLSLVVNVTLEELYAGCEKGFAVKRKVYNDQDELVTEKKKIVLNIEPGMRDEEQICFENQADERKGYERGDIIFTLCVQSHPVFERIGDNLYMDVDVSLYETYQSCFNITHLNGTEIKIQNTPTEPLHLNGGLRKLQGQGMPIQKSDKYGDLFIKFSPVLPQEMDQEKLELLKSMFPPLNDQLQFDDSESNLKLEMASESDIEDCFDSESDDDYSSDELSETDSE